MSDTKDFVSLTDFLSVIVNKLREGTYPAQIAKEMGVSKQRLYYWINRLLQLKIIVKSPESEKGICDFYTVNPAITTIDKSLLSSRYVRPHNYAIKFKIIKDSDTAWEREVPVKYWYKKFDYSFEDVVFEKTTKHVIGFLRKRVDAYVRTPSDVDNLKAHITYIITEASRQLSEKYGMELDLENPTISRREIEVKDDVLDRIPDDIRIRNGVFKKVYPKKVEFKDEISVKNYIKNRALEDIAPELAEAVNGLGRNFDEKLDKLMEIDERFAKNLELHLSVLQDMNKSITRLNRTLISEKISLIKEKRKLKVEKEQKSLKNWF